MTERRLTTRIRAIVSGWMREEGRSTIGIAGLLLTSIPVLWLAFWIAAPGYPDFGTDTAFPAVLAERFPPGTPLETFGAALEEAEFVVVELSGDGRTGRAVLSRQFLFCAEGYQVRWTAGADATLASLSGSDTSTC
ncbi:MAG: hypothetical protein AAGJ96_07655 [Pseudomonadota bacterium]